MSRLAFPFHRHLDYGVSSLKKIIINLRLWHQWKVLLFLGEICTNGFFLGTHNQQCCSADAVVVVIVFASLRCLPDPFSLGIVRLWEFTVGRCRSLVVLPGGVVNRGLGLPLYRSPLVTWKWCAYKSPAVILLSQGREIVIIGWRGRSWRYVWRRRQREQEIAIRRHMLLLNLNFDGSCQCSIMVLECAVLLSSVCGRDFFWNWNNAEKWLTWG